MCGILGVVSQNSLSALQDRVVDAGKTLRHRGPDDEGWYADEQCILVHKRLAIIDLTGGKQPIYNEDGRYVLIFNGEIYNYRELQKELVGKGHQLRTRSDSEVIIHLYEDEGAECVHKLRGMFAFAIWDTKERTLFLARDRLGIKPLHYTKLPDGTFIFASEIKAILATGLIEAEMCPWALREYLSFKFTVGSRTFFKDIWTLEPGFQAIWKDGNTTLRRYWDHHYSPQTITFKQAQEAFESVFEDTVRSHLVSDVPVGLFLSGGLDTSANTLTASKFYPGTLKTYTCGTKNEKNGDLHYARLVADQCHTEHHEVIHNAEEFGAFMQDCIWYLDEPGGGSTAIHGYYVSKRAVQDVKVLLSGEGADEVLGGYFHYWMAVYNAASFGQRLSHYWRWWDWSKRSFLSTGLRELVLPSQISVLDRFLHRHNHFSQAQQEELLNDSVLSQTKEFTRCDVIKPLLSGCDTLPMCQQLMSLDLRTYLYRILHIYDRMCMAAQLENRVPFMDHQFVEFTMSLPPHVIFRNLESKALLRRFLATKLNRQVALRPKTGFTLPVDQWLRHELRPDIEGLLNGLACREIFRPEGIHKLWQGFLARKVPKKTIWSLVSIEYWFRNFIDPQ